jgi:hypothetical protein
MVFGFVWQVIKPVVIITGQFTFRNFDFIFLVSTSYFIADFLVSELDVFAKVMSFFLAFLLFFSDFVNLIKDLLARNLLQFGRKFSI